MMQRILWAEVRKLVHPVIVVVLLVACAFMWTDARTTFNFARLQTPVAVTATASVQAAAADCSRGGGDCHPCL